MTAGDVVAVYVPCDVVDVKVRLGFSETLSPMEEIVLRAVHAGFGSVDQLESLLGLGKRLTFDLIQDLWHCGHLRLVHARAAVVVSQKIADHIRDDTLAEVAGAEAVDDRLQVMVDKLTGQVQPASGTWSPPSQQLAVPVENSKIRVESAQYGDLLTALDRALARRRDQHRDIEMGLDPNRVAVGREQFVLSARLAPDELRSRSSRRWVPINVRPTLDQDADRLIITVVEAAMPEAVRNLASAKLTAMAEENPRVPLFAHLRGVARPGPAAAPAPHHAIRRLREQASMATSIPAGRRHDWHHDMCALARQLAGLLDDRVAREVRADVAASGSWVDSLDTLIKSARHQIVLTSPAPRSEQIDRVIPALRDAVNGGVQVVVLWGPNFNSVLDPKSRNSWYLLQLAAGATPRSPHVMVPETPARTRANFAVADDRRVLLTGSGLLSTARDRPGAGLVLSAPDGRGSQLIRELLAWVGETAPFDVERLLLRTERDFALRDRASARSGGHAARRAPTPDRRIPLSVSTRLVQPAEPPDTADESAANAVQGWQQAWESYTDAAQAAMDRRTSPAAALVQDGEHRDLLWTALRSAERRLVVVADLLVAEALSDRFVNALSERLERGVQITIVHRAAPGQAEAVARLDGIREGHPHLMRVIERSDSGSMLLWDDEIVVGSFGFLSADSLNRHQGLHQKRRELSIRLTGGTVADAVARIVGVPMDEGAAGAIPEVARPAAAATSPAAYVAAQFVLNAVAAGVPAVEALREQLRNSPDYWATLERLAVVGTPRLVRTAAAMCLSMDRDAASATCENWRKWLVLDLWAAGDFVEAALLRSAVTDDTFRPRSPITLLGAALGREVVQTAFEDAFPLLEGDETERAALLAVALHLMLVEGRVVTPDMLRYIAELAFPEPSAEGRQAGAPHAEVWRVVSEAAAEYTTAAYQQPLPLAAIRSQMYGRRRHEAVQAAWGELDAVLEQATTRTFMVAPSRNTHAFLFHRKEAVFSVLAGAVAARDQGGVATWLDALPPGGVVELLDNAVATVAVTTKPMEGKQKMSLQRMLVHVSERCRAVIEAAEADETDRTIGSDLLIPARRLADVLALHWSDLTAHADTLPGPEARLVKYLLTEMSVLAAWSGRDGLETADE